MSKDRKAKIKIKATAKSNAKIAAMARKRAKSSKTKVLTKKKLDLKVKLKTGTKLKVRNPSKMLTVKSKSRSFSLEGYSPSDSEPFMGGRQRAYFRAKLQAWKDEILRQTKGTLDGLLEDSTQHADLADRATSETDRALELRARDRQRKLIAKIEAALARLEDGTYGFCDETGEPIGLRRLDARPIATLSVEAQERHERRERIYRED